MSREGSGGSRRARAAAGRLVAREHGGHEAGERRAAGQGEFHAPHGGILDHPVELEGQVGEVLDRQLEGHRLDQHLVGPLVEPAHRRDNGRDPVGRPGDDERILRGFGHRVAHAVAELGRARDDQRVGARIGREARPRRRDRQRGDDGQHLRRLAVAQRDGLYGVARRRVEPVNKLHDAPEVLAPVRQDHQAGIGHGREHRPGGQKRADHLGHLLDRAVAQRDHPGFEIAAAPRAGLARRQFARHVERHDAVGLVSLDDGQTVEFEHVEKDLVDRIRCDGIGGHHSHRALNPGVEDEVAPGRLRHDLNEVPQARFAQIKRDLRSTGQSGSNRAAALAVEGTALH